MQIDFIDLKTQYSALETDINARIQKVLKHGLFILGPEVKECEEALAKFTGSKHVLAVSSGTDALLMAMMALGIGPGDEVITSPFTFVANAEMIVLLGATPVLVDIETDTYNIDASKIEAAITKKTKAIMPIGLYGQTADMDAINAIGAKHGIPVIEDAAQSFGAEYKGKKSCNLAAIGCTSFFPAKPLGCYGDGGAVFTNDDNLFKVMNEIRTHGQEKRYYHTRLGINGRLDTLQCAILIPKIGRFPWEIQRRQEVAQRYNEGFKNLEGKIFTPKVRPDRLSVYAQYTLFTEQRDQLIEKLTKANIPTAVHYPISMHEQPIYKDKVRFTSLKNSEKASQCVMSLPMHPDMKTDVQDFIIKTVNAALS
jgi:UDP-2-acetamido-2-deoxy-ribo-hexuluronate aminotransferase